MPSAIAAIPLTVQGVDVQRSDLSLFLEVAEGLGAGASVRGGDVLVPGLPGRRSRNRLADVLALELAGWIKAASLSAYRDLVQELNLLFRPSRGPVELSATLERICVCCAGGKTSSRRLSVVAASLVCIVPITRWPVSEALIAISIVSRSRSSPMTITSGSSRRAPFRAVKNDFVCGPTSRWVTLQPLGG